MDKRLAALSCVALLSLAGISTAADAPPDPASVAGSPTPAPVTTPAATHVSPAAPTEPQLIGADKISAGDTAWMLTSTALVLMMTNPGLALFYGGLVRKENVLATLMQSFAVTCVITLLWWLIGDSLAFTPGSAWLGGTSRLLLNGMRVLKDDNPLTVSHRALTIPETVYAMFQLTFAIITAPLITGAFAERMKFFSRQRSLHTTRKARDR